MDQILGSFFSKVGEIIANYAHNKLETNFKLITLKTLQKNLKSLSVKACDVKEQIKHAECSGQKKRKREVEEWLGEVKSIETQVVELGTRVESQGFINEDIRAGRVHRALSEMKNAIILILDDVCQNIDLLKVGCPFSVECCRLIMTTRSLKVCHQIGCEEVIAVRTLGEDEAWKLFHDTFTLGKEINLDPQVEAIAKSVAKMCGGLPLGIITLAGSMRGQTTIHGWRNALEELKKPFTDHDGMREGEVLKVLKYSFDRLQANHPSLSKDFNSLQLCFLYLSLYPEDKEVYKERLIGEFISEGLLDTRESRRAQFDRGHVILDKLVNGCLLESGVNYIGEYLKMHDLVRGMALEIGRGKIW